MTKNVVCITSHDIKHLATGSSQKTNPICLRANNWSGSHHALHVAVFVQYATTGNTDVYVYNMRHEKAITLDIVYLLQAYFLWFQRKSSFILNPFWPQGVFFFLLPCFSGKTRSAEQLWHVYENEREKKTVSMLIICYVKGLNSSASCQHSRYHTRACFLSPYWLLPQS